MRYLVLDADWLDREIATAEVLTDHAHASGKNVAIAAASIRLESLKEILKLAAPALPEGEGEIRLSIATAPRAPAPPDA